MMREHPEAYSAKAARPGERRAAARPDRGAGADDSARAARRRRRRVRHRLLERRQPDPGALGAPRGRAGRARRARREPRRAAADAARREPRALRRRRRARRAAGAAARRLVADSPRASRCARSRSPSTPACCGSAPASRWPRPCCSPTSRACRSAHRGERASPLDRAGCQRAHHARHQPPPAHVRDDADRVLVRAARRRRHAARGARRVQTARAPATTCGRCWRSTCRRRSLASATRRRWSFYQESDAARSAQLPGVAARRARELRAVARRRQRSVPGFSSPPRATHRPTARRTRTARLRIVAPGFFAVLGVPLFAGRDFTRRRSRRRRAGGDREPERRAAAVPRTATRSNRQIWWTDPYFGKPRPRRIVGVVADVDDENVVARAGAHDLSPRSADARRRAAVRARRRAIPTRW